MAESPLIEGARRFLGSYIGLLHRSTGPGGVAGRALPAEHHWRVIDALCGEGNNLIVMPRDSAKTTYAQAWVEWLLGRASLSGEPSWAESFRVLYLRSSADLAAEVSNAIRQTVVSEVYQALFPNVKPHPEKWNQQEWRVVGNDTKDANFRAYGIGSPPLGARADLIVLDDIADEENMSTPGERQKVRRKLARTVMPMLVPGGRAVMLMTRWAWDDPADWAMSQGWEVVEQKAIIENEAGEEVSYWPERYPIERLRLMREADPEAFAQQYQNEVAPEEGLVFLREWFGERYEYLPDDVVARVDSWDTASEQGRRRAYSVGLSALVTAKHHIYLRDMLRAQLNYPDLKQAIREVAGRNRSHTVIIEKKASGHQAIQELRQEGIPIVEFQPFGQKGSPTRREANQRISDICAQRRVHLPSYPFQRRVRAHWLPDFEGEVFSYPDGKSDDIVDALCQLLWWVETQRFRQLSRAEPLRWARSRGQPVLIA